MSYCVNCGVELGDAEKSCPLCHVPVQNPLKPWTEPERAPYPKRVETVLNSVDRRYAVLITTLALSVALLCCVLMDILTAQGITWSGYVAGGLVCIFVWALLPLLVRRPNVYLCILYDTGALILYLAAILYQAKAFHAFLFRAAPLALLVCGMAYACTPVVRSRKLAGKLYKPAILLLLFAAFCLAAELIIDMYVTNGAYRPDWSVVVAAVSVITGLLLFMLEGRNRLKDRIIRRLFI